MIGVNVNGYDASTLTEAMAKEKLTWRSFADPGTVGQGAIACRWNVTSTPTIYVIDQQGLIRYKWVGSPGAHAIDVALDRLLKEAER